MEGGREGGREGERERKRECARDCPGVNAGEFVDFIGSTVVRVSCWLAVE